MTFWSSSHVTNVKPYICTSTIPMVTKLKRVVTSGGGTQPFKPPFDYRVTWYMKKNYICKNAIPMATKLRRVVTCSGGTLLQYHVTFWLHGHLTNEKNLYLYFNNIYGLKTWQSGKLRWGNPTFKVILWLWGQVTHEKTYIFNSVIPMVTKLGRAVTYCWETPPTKLHGLLIMWSCDKCKTLYLHFRNTFDHQTWLSRNLVVVGPQLQSHVMFWLCGHWQLQTFLIFFLQKDFTCTKSTKTHISQQKHLRRRKSLIHFCKTKQTAFLFV